MVAAPTLGKTTVQASREVSCRLCLLVFFFPIIPAGTQCKIASSSHNSGPCTCEDDEGLPCAPFNRYDCKDSSASCFGEETTTDDSPDVFPSFDDYVGDDDQGTSISYNFTPDEVDESLPTVDGAVEVGTKTEVTVYATAHDVRPGRTSFERGCGVSGGDGCAAELTRDGIATEIESRWSCATKIVPGGGACQIEYVFGEPQDVVDIQVAFWKGNERTRTLEVREKVPRGCPEKRRVA